MAKANKIAYWIITVYLAVALFYGGLAEVLDASLRVTISSIGIVGVVQVLGYPLYVLYIIGIWKMLGAVAILIPRFPRLKEWAYAGIVFNMSGAFISWLIVTVYGGVQIPDGYGSPVFHVVNALHLLVLALLSWALRPESRRLGNILPITSFPGASQIGPDVQATTRSAPGRFLVAVLDRHADSDARLRP